MASFSLPSAQGCVPWSSRKLRRALLRLVALALVVGYVFLPSSDGGLFSGGADLPEPAAAALEEELSANSSSSHPIDELIARGHARWQAKLARQSTTLDEAVAEYNRRYGRPPPKGFDDWHAFATDHDFVLVDEFDAIDEDLKLFRLLTSEELRKRTRQAMLQEVAYGLNLKDGAFTVVSPVNEGETKRGDPARARVFGMMLSPNAHKLPDMEWAMIGLAESLVAPPWEKCQPINMTLELEDISPFVTKRNQASMWSKLSNSCNPASPVRQHPELYTFPERSGILAPRIGVSHSQPFGRQQSPDDFDVEQALETPSARFLSQTEASKDLCSISPDRFYEYGAMYSGRSVYTEIYPVFGPGRGPGTIDIRVPANYYYRSRMGYTYGYDGHHSIDLDNPLDPQWEDKEDTIYWRGSTTGGGNTPPGRYPFYPRHRLVQLAVQPSNLSIPLVRRSADGTYEATLTPVEDLRPSLDMAFTSTKQCSMYPGGCDRMRADYKFAEPVPLDDAFRSKMVFDIDGMGYSARFLALLSSRSAVVKATVYREFHDDWLEPWVHYIPASSHYQELFNIWAYFLGDATPKGDAALRRIADDSRQAKFTHLRFVDLEDVYRLALEWARLWYQDYEDMDYHPPAPPTPT